MNYRETTITQLELLKRRRAKLKEELAKPV